MADLNGYPDKQELRKIKNWDYHDFNGLMEYVKDLWKWADRGFEIFAADSQNDALGTRYELSTGGWSGNESIIGALQSNLMFWAIAWQESKRGGHYKFEIRKGQRNGKDRTPKDSS